MGLNANANMKREAINESEINADDKTMIPLIQQMEKEVKEGIDKVNSMFNTSISVRLSDVWNKMKEEVIEDEPINEDITEKIEEVEEGDNNEDVEGNK